MFKTRKYKKPSIHKRAVKINLFSTPSRYSRSFDGEVYFNSVLLASCCPACILAGTKILLSSFKEKNIENIELGDIVLSYNTLTKGTEKNKVTKLLVHTDAGKEFIILNKTLRITPNHRLWVNNTIWKRVDELTIGDQIIGAQTKLVQITSLEWKRGNHRKVYNLHLEGSAHNYFADNVLIHNSWPVEEKL